MANVRPKVENGVITVEVTLENKRHPILRHNLRVEVYVVTASTQNALLVERGQFPIVEGVPMVFALRGDKAIRTPVQFGLKNYEYYEVLEGLAEGDEVIVSDMSDYKHIREVRLK